MPKEANESLDQVIQRLNSIENLLKNLHGYSATKPKEILGIDEVAELLGKSIDTIHRYTHKKIIPHYRPSGTTLIFNRSEIIAWIKSGKVRTIGEIEEDADAHADATLIAMNKRRRA